VSAASLILDRAFGRAPSFSTSNADDFKRVTELTDEQLISIAVAGGIHVEPRPT
jgi:hypothetical protein